ncbi:hypothetical protein KAT24_00680 [Candidatus Pacearchaeota archaeon]|nr:hypothetical protein [Candidatus Pacearchaeota archaeon]
MEDYQKKDTEDISKEIEKTIPEQKKVVAHDLAEKEEKIAKSVGEIPITKDELAIRKEKVISFLKKKKDWIYCLILSFIVFIGMYIRTRNISKLKDITTGTWTLGPDLDPFLFLRWAKHIVEHGKLFLLDAMRNVPLIEICSGQTCNPINTMREMTLLPYMMAWFHKFLALFSKNITVTYSAVIFPVFMFGLTTIAFFLFARKIFYKQTKKIKNIIALISTAFFVVIPSLLPRTIAGIPEKESAGFFFMFMAFYFFLEAFTSEKLKRGMIFGILAGIMTACMGLTWGGVGYIFITISAAVIFSFLLGKITKKRFYVFTIWIISFTALMISLSGKYTFTNLMTSTSSGLAFLGFFILLIDFTLFKKKLIKIPAKITNKIPKRVISVIIAIVILTLLSTIIFGISFIPNKMTNFISQTVHPLDVGRFGSTVAENRQPYFINDWRNEFGPVQWNIPLFFWLFFIGSVFLFNHMIQSLSKKEKIILTFGYIIFLLGLIFSKYSSGSMLNGETSLSFIVYFGGVIAFISFFGYFYFKRYKENALSVFKKFEFSYILYFIILTMAIMGARGAIRLIMVLGAVSPVAIGFLVVMGCKKYNRKGEETKRFFIGVIVLIILIASMFTLWVYYNQSKNVAENFAPGSYQWQWQKAMEWVRENTPVNAVFAHWWDYGYWLQSIGERATVLDGGNSIAYWNHFMGRHVLTGTNERTALEFLYAHNTTHFLIDSTEIGKYTAYSSIGSDENYDKFSWISTFFMDDAQTQETKEETLYLYQGGTLVDEDLLLEIDEKEIFLPRKQAAVGAIIIRKGKDKISQPEVIFVYKGKQYNQPLRFVYLDGELHDFGSGIEAGVFLFPKLESSGGNFNANPIGAAFYLSGRVVNSQLAQLYLFEKESEYFKIAHVESNLFISDMKNQGVNLGEFVYYNGFQGPIKIWEINYPSDIQLNENYLITKYPKELQITNPEEY